jgi:hypothetical protein
MKLHPQCAIGLVLAGTMAAVPALANVTVIVNPADPHKTPVTYSYTNNNPVIRLGEGDQALIYYDDQTMDRVTGPYNGPLSQLHGSQVAKDSLLGRLGKVFARADERSLNVGAARGASDPSAPAADEPPATIPATVDPLDINLDTSVAQCFLTTPLHLWQARAPAGAQIVLSHIGGGSALLTVDSANGRVIWPRDVRLEEGEYVVAYLNAPRDAPTKTHIFTLKRLAVDDPDHYTVADLVAADCTYQATIKARLLIKAQPGQ